MKMILRRLIMFVSFVGIIFIVCSEIAFCETYYFVSSNNNVLYAFDVEDGRAILKEIYEKVKYDSQTFRHYAFVFYREELARFINTRIIDGMDVSYVSCECNCLEIFKDIRGCKLENHLIVNYNPKYGSLSFKIYYYTKGAVVVTAKTS
jgi:hypothetical protein